MRDSLGGDMTIQDHREGSSEPVDLSPARHLGLLLIWVVLAATSVGLAAVLKSALGLPFMSGLFGEWALLEAWCTWRTPWWFWEIARTRIMRSIIGDRATRIVCGVASVVLAFAAYKFSRVH